MRHRLVVAAAVVSLIGPPLLALQQQQQQQQPPPPAGQGRGQGRGQRQQRDANRPAAPTGTAVIAGRVLAADSGRPLKRARVIVAAAGRPHVTTTDELGRYRVTALPAGSYSVTATKTGYVDSMFGQRRALRAGTPLQVADGQEVGSIDLRLQRGGVITGRVLDEDGEPLARSLVTILRYQYLRGQKQLMPAGTDQSDDRGQFRVFGLPPGEYFVSATASGLERMVGVIAEQALAAGRGRAVLAAGRGLQGGGRGGFPFAEEESESTGYAPTYYPGTITSADAQRLRLAVAQELGGIDFQLQLVQLATVRGVVTDPRGNVMLVPEEGIGGMMGQALRAPVLADGSFTIRNVPPGKYTAVARWEEFFGSDTSIAMQALTVSGSDVTVNLVPVKGARVIGTITFESTGKTTPATFDGFRVNAISIDAGPILPRGQRPADAQSSGVFELTGLMPGRYAIQANGRQGWTMKSATLDGRDVSDGPFEIKGGETINGVNVIFGDRTSSLAGTVRSGANPAPAGLTVIVFPADEKLWRPQSRRIQTARTDQSGQYRLANLPPGDYLIVAVEDVEPGEWFDPAYLESIGTTAARLSIDDGEQKTLDLKWSAQ